MMTPHGRATAKGRRPEVPHATWSRPNFGNFFIFNFPILFIFFRFAAVVSRTEINLQHWLLQVNFHLLCACRQWLVHVFSFLRPFPNLRPPQVGDKSTCDSTVLVKIVTEILFWECDFGETMKQLFWQQITDQRTKKKDRDLDHAHFFLGIQRTFSSVQFSSVQFIPDVRSLVLAAHTRSFSHFFFLNLRVFIKE